MNKKIFGIRLGTIITLIVCIAVALAIWMIVNYKIGISEAETTCFFDVVQRLK